MIYFTSDTHFSQNNIIKGNSVWGLRDFKNAAHMNDIIIKGINDYVKKGDLLYHLGDFYFGKSTKELMDIRSRIVCSNIHFIKGNHDHFTVKHPEIFSSINSYYFFSPKVPPENDPFNSPWTKQRICLSHYAMRVWHHSHRGAWMLYGHSHSSLDNIPGQVEPHKSINKFYLKYKTMDVGVDNIYRLTGEYRPISLLEVNKYMKDKLILTVDHHRGNGER